MSQYFVNVWDAIVAFFVNAGPMACLSAVAGAIVCTVIMLYVSNVERQKEMREIDEQEWGELGKALIQSFEQVDEGEVPVGTPNDEYCYSLEPGHTGGWFCSHLECKGDPEQDEQDMQALDMSIVGVDCPACHMFLEEGHQCPDEDELGPEAQQAMNAFQRMQASEPTWEERERLNDLERIAYCGWED